MANEYAVNSADLTSVADAIREKGGTEDLLSFPAGFVAAIQNMKSGGGASLNVINVASKDALPGTANENTIAVVTDTEIGAVYIQKEQPETANTGDMFISTASGLCSIDMTGEEDGCIQIDLGYVFVWSGTEWTYADAYVYTGNEWFPLTNIEYLYNNGQINGITWQKGEGSATATIGDTYMEMKTTSDSANRIHVSTAQKVNLAEYKTLYVTADCTEFNPTASTDPMLRIGVASSSSSSLASASTKVQEVFYGTGVKTLSYDISSINSQMYIIVGIGWPKATVRITKVWLEKAV